MPEAMMDIQPQILWQPHPGPQMEALAYRVYELLYGGARGGGKTEAGIMFLIEDDYHLNPLYRALVVRKNADDLKDWIDRAERIYIQLGAKKVGTPVEFIFPSGAKIRTGHLKDDNAYTKYQGQEYQKMLLEELTHIATEQRYEMLIASCRSTVPGLIAQIFATTNPNGKGHVWVKKRFVKGENIPKPGTVWIPEKTLRPRLFIPSKVFDNPTLVNNDPGYINFLKGLTPTLRAMWLDGSWDVGAGEFFEEWDEKIHVCTPFDIPEHWKRFICMDYGFTNQTAVLWCAVDPSSGKVFVYRELYVTQHTYEMVAETIYRMTPADEVRSIDWMAVDSSIFDSGKETGKTGYDIMKEVFRKDETKFPVPIRLATKGPGSRLNGWNLVRSYLRHKKDELGKTITRLQVFKTCTNFIRVMPEQLFDENNVEDLDTDGEDHIPDAIRYGLRTLSEPWDKKQRDDTPPKRQAPTLTNDELFFRLEREQRYIKR